MGTILEAMNEHELAEACRRVGFPADGTDRMRRALDEGLARAEWKALRREAAAASPRQLVPIQVELLDVIDGDTLRVHLDSHETLVRIRGIDTPETSESDKAEEDLDRTRMNRRRPTRPPQRTADRHDDPAGRDVPASASARKRSHLRCTARDAPPALSAGK